MAWSRATREDHRCAALALLLSSATAANVTESTDTAADEPLGEWAGKVCVAGHAAAPLCGGRPLRWFRWPVQSPLTPVLLTTPPPRKPRSTWITFGVFMVRRGPRSPPTVEKPALTRHAAGACPSRRLQAPGRKGEERAPRGRCNAAHHTATRLGGRGQPAAAQPDHRPLFLAPAGARSAPPLCMG